MVGIKDLLLRNPCLLFNVALEDEELFEDTEEEDFANATAKQKATTKATVTRLTAKARASSGDNTLNVADCFEIGGKMPSENFPR